MHQKIITQQSVQNIIENFSQQFLSSSTSWKKNELKKNAISANTQQQQQQSIHFIFPKQLFPHN